MCSETPAGISPQGDTGSRGGHGASRELASGVAFGLAFGFLLQKGGVAKYDLLMGALLLTDATVPTVMLAAIAVGMAGVFAMHSFGWVRLHEKPTRYAANILGGLLFGVGFALFGYCPGTAAAALGQGNYDAVAGLLGLLAGSWLYAEASGWLGRTVESWGRRGLLSLPTLLGMPRKPLVVVASVILMAVAVCFDVLSH